MLGQRALLHTRPDELQQHTRAAAQQYQQVEAGESLAEERWTSHRSELNTGRNAARTDTRLLRVPGAHRITRIHSFSHPSIHSFIQSCTHLFAVEVPSLHVVFNLASVLRPSRIITKSEKVIGAKRTGNALSNSDERERQHERQESISHLSP